MENDLEATLRRMGLAPDPRIKTALDACPPEIHPYVLQGFASLQGKEQSHGLLGVTKKTLGAAISFLTSPFAQKDADPQKSILELNKQGQIPQERPVGLVRHMLDMLRSQDDPNLARWLQTDIDHFEERRKELCVEQLRVLLERCVVLSEKKDAEVSEPHVSRYIEFVRFNPMCISAGLRGLMLLYGEMKGPRGCRNPDAVLQVLVAFVDELFQLLKEQDVCELMRLVASEAVQYPGSCLRLCLAASKACLSESVQLQVAMKALSLGRQRDGDVLLSVLESLAEHAQQFAESVQSVFVQHLVVFAISAPSQRQKGAFASLLTRMLGACSPRCVYSLLKTAHNFVALISTKSSADRMQLALEMLDSRLPAIEVVVAPDPELLAFATSLFTNVQCSCSNRKEFAWAAAQFVSDFPGSPLALAASDAVVSAFDQTRPFSADSFLRIVRLKEQRPSVMMQKMCLEVVVQGDSIERVISLTKAALPADAAEIEALASYALEHLELSDQPSDGLDEKLAGDWVLELHAFLRGLAGLDHDVAFAVLKALLPCKPVQKLLIFLSLQQVHGAGYSASLIARLQERCQPFARNPWASQFCIRVSPESAALQTIESEGPASPAVVVDMCRSIVHQKPEARVTSNTKPAAETENAFLKELTELFSP